MRYLVLILLTACIGQHEGARCRRAQRHVIAATEMCPGLLKRDTVTIYDTTIIESVRADTVFNADFDTITITKERLRVRLVHIRDSIYLTGECKGDTIYKSFPVYREKVVVRTPTFIEELMSLKGLFWLLLIILAACGGVYIRNLFKK